MAKTASAYVHANRGTMLELGQKLGLEGEALRLFSFMATELRIDFTYKDDGTGVVTHVNSMLLVTDEVKRDAKDAARTLRFEGTSFSHGPLGKAIDEAIRILNEISK